MELGSLVSTGIKFPEASEAQEAALNYQGMWLKMAKYQNVQQGQISYTDLLYWLIHGGISKAEVEEKPMRVLL